MSVFSNAAFWLVWQVRQTFSPTKAASTGALERCRAAAGPFGVLAAGEDCEEEPPCRNSSKLLDSANFGRALIDSGWAVPRRWAKACSAE